MTTYDEPDVGLIGRIEPRLGVGRRKDSLHVPLDELVPYGEEWG